MLKASQSHHDVEGLLDQRIGLGHPPELENGGLGQAVETLGDFGLCVLRVLLLELPLEQREDLFINFVCGDRATAWGPVEQLRCPGWRSLVPAHIEHVIVLRPFRIEVSWLPRWTT